MKNFIFCILALIMSFVLTSCEEQKYEQGLSLDFDLGLYLEDGENQISVDAFNKLLDKPMTIVCDDDSINVSNPLHPEWNPMWPPLNGSRPMILNAELTSGKDSKYYHIFCTTSGFIQTSTIEFDFVIEPVKWHIKIVDAEKVFINGSEAQPFTHPVKLVLSDKDLSDIHAWTTRQQGN